MTGPDRARRFTSSRAPCQPQRAESGKARLHLESFLIRSPQVPAVGQESRELNVKDGVSGQRECVGVGVGGAAHLLSLRVRLSSSVRVRYLSGQTIKGTEIDLLQQVGVQLTGDADETNDHSGALWTHTRCSSHSAPALGDRVQTKGLECLRCVDTACSWRAALRIRPLGALRGENPVWRRKASNIWTHLTNGRVILALRSPSQLFPEGRTAEQL